MTDKELAEMWQKRAEMISMTCDSMNSKYHAAMAAGHAAQATIAFLKAKYSIPDSDVESQPFATWYDRYLTERSHKENLLKALQKLVDYADGFNVSGVYMDEEPEGKKVIRDAYVAIELATGE